MTVSLAKQNHTTITVKRDDNILVSCENFNPDSQKISLIVGASGLGKTSFLSALSGVGCQEGLEVDGEVPVGSYVFQSSNLYNDLTIKQNFEIVKLHNKPITVQLQEMISKFIGEINLEVFPHQLSGGQVKRAAIVRALYAPGDYLFLDEPTAGLDVENSEKFTDILEELVCLGRNVIIATHDPEAFSRLPMEIYYINKQKQLVMDPTEYKSKSVKKENSFNIRATEENIYITREPRYYGWVKAFVAKDLWNLSFSLSNTAYFCLASGLMSFVVAYITLTRFPFSGVIFDLSISKLIVELGDSSYRYNIPLIVSILFAARMSSLISTEFSIKSFNKEFLSLAVLNVPLTMYRGIMVIAISVFSIFFLYFLCLSVCLMTIYLVLNLTLDTPSYIVKNYLFQEIISNSFGLKNFFWIFIKLLLSGFFVSLSAVVIGCYRIIFVNQITERASSSVLWGVLMVILIHAILIVSELNSLPVFKVGFGAY